MSIIGLDGRPLGADKRISGKMAVRIMAEEIGLVIGQRRLREFDRKVRARVKRDHPFGANGSEWIRCMAEVIVEDDDTKADQGFRKGIRRIRELGGDV